MPDLATNRPTLEDAGPVVHAKACMSCGAPVEPLDQFCGSCGAEQASAAGGRDAPAPKFFRCENCGAEVAIDPDRRSYHCPFCDSNYVVEFSREQSGRQSPEFVIGFAITPEKAMEAFRQWLGRGGLFRPGDLRQAEIAERLRGVYIPFWSFSMLARSNWSAQIGEHWYRTETYTTVENGKTVTKTRQVQETEWWSLGGRHHRYYSGYLVSGSRGLGQRDAEPIKPFHLVALRRYQPYFLAGWIAEEYSVDQESAIETCVEEFRRLEQNNVAGFLPGDTHRGLRVDTQFSDVGSDLVLLPIYLLSYRYRNKLYRFLLNGQTGKAAGRKPLSGWKIGIAAGLIVLLVFLLVLFVQLLSR